MQLLISLAIAFSFGCLIFCAPPNSRASSATKNNAGSLQPKGVSTSLVNGGHENRRNGQPHQEKMDTSAAVNAPLRGATHPRNSQSATERVRAIPTPLTTTSLTRQATHPTLSTNGRSTITTLGSLQSTSATANVLHRGVTHPRNAQSATERGRAIPTPLTTTSVTWQATHPTLSTNGRSTITTPGSLQSTSATANAPHRGGTHHMNAQRSTEGGRTSPVPSTYTSVTRQTTNPTLPPNGPSVPRTDDSAEDILILEEGCDVSTQMGSPAAIIELDDIPSGSRSHETEITSNLLNKRAMEELEESVGEETHLKKKVRTSDSPRCSLTFSEFYPGSPENSQDEFLEMNMKCSSRSGPPPRNTLKGYSRFVFRCQPFALVLVSDLGDPSLCINSHKTLIVLGSAKTRNIDIRLDQAPTHSVYQNSRYRSLLPTIEDSPYGFVIAYSNTKRPLKNFKLLEVSQQLYPQSVLSENDLEALKSAAVDMLIVGPKEHSKSCGPLNNIWPTSISPSAHILTKLKAGDSFRDKKSISKCFSLHENFQPQQFFISNPTAGEPNDCSSKLSLFEEAEGIVIERTRGQLSKESCEPNSIPAEKATSKIDYQVYVDISKKGLYTENKVNQHILDACDGQLPASEQVLQIPGLSDWLKVTVADDKCTFECKYCTAFFSFGFRPDVKHKQNIMKPTGFSSKNPYENYRQIKFHDQHVLHKTSTVFAQKFIQATNQIEVNEITNKFEDEEARLFEATRNVVRLVYAEMKAGLSFKAHEELIEAVSLAGANIGFHHQSAVASMNILNSISSEFHKKLLSYLVETKAPFSIIVDSTTNQNEPLLIVYLQTLEDGYPVMHFYALITLENGEKAAEMTKSFVKRIEHDDGIQAGFQNYFKTCLVAVVSDGASVMVGSKNSFHVLIEAYVDRKVPLIKCFAHKLDLGVKAGLKPRKAKLTGLDESKPGDKKKIDQLKYFQEFENHNNEFYRFYSGRSHKKWQHLCHLAEAKGETLCTAKCFQPIRWSESSYNCMDSVAKNFDLYAEDLVLISTSKDFDKTSQQEASRLLNKLTDKTYAVVVREFLDFLNIFKALSKTLQESSGILIGKSNLILQSLEELLKLKNAPGPKVVEFLKFCHCDGICEIGTCSYEDYYNCPSVHYKTSILKENDPLGIKMSTARVELYENLIQNVSGYFNLAEIQAFDVLDPTRINFAFDDNLPYHSLDQLYLPWPTIEAVSIQRSDADSKVTAVCNFYKHDVQTCESFLVEFQRLIFGIVHSEFLKDFHTEDGSKFWPLALSQSQLPWTKLTREIVTKIMVTPFASSDCERGFSFVNSLRSKERSCLTTKVLEGRVRIKANGPDELSEFDDYFYTRKFLAEYARVDDVEVSGGRPANPLNDAFFFKKSRVFRRPSV